jgi:hypothetical protein
VETAVLSSDEGRDGRPASYMVCGTEALSSDFARSLRPASMARCAGSSGGFASYRRDPLVEAHREGGGRWPGACYNFLYEIQER